MHHFSDRVSIPNLASLGMLTLCEKVMHLGFLGKFQNKSCPIGQTELRSSFGSCIGSLVLPEIIGSQSLRLPLSLFDIRVPESRLSSIVLMNRN